MFYRKLDDNKYKTSSDKFTDSFKLIKLLLDNNAILLEPIYYDENIMDTQFYDKVTEYSTLEYPQTSVQYLKHEPQETTHDLSSIL